MQCIWPSFSDQHSDQEHITFTIPCEIIFRPSPGCLFCTIPPVVLFAEQTIE